ncbi:MAG TPA: PEGA domain-containing protein [Vicinamibacterales bacterium]|nr:PEGA domain-containing protein [Vicinamibacterales bacterium]
MRENSEPPTAQIAVANPGSPLANPTGTDPIANASSQGPAPSPRSSASAAVAAPTGVPTAMATDLPRPAVVAAPGWVSIPISIQVQVFENGRFVGTNDANQIPLAAGRHELELVNEFLHYRGLQRVEVSSGKTVTLRVALPTGTLNLNAAPWAEVTIDGQSVGQTPLGNLQVPIGPHQMVFRHPELGEETRSIVVGAGSSTRVSVTFNK